MSPYFRFIHSFALASLRPGFAGLTIDYKSWSDTTREDAKAHSDDHLYVYFASKAVAEKAVWDYAAEHTELDVATVLPAFVYGPYADHFPLPSSSGLGTNGYVYMLIKGGMPPTPPPFVVDVRDVAKAHVLALSVEPKPLGEKRYIASAGNLSWHDAAVAVKKAHPEVATAPLDTFPDLPGPPSTLDNKHTTEQLNFGTWITPEQTMIDTTEGFAVVEKSWA
ncbi:hypothetical protein H0H93_006931 [Arthromyces matolae]|nr:hypothetical protein H0H93_006931 [Arthromyces matolae]